MQKPAGVGIGKKPPVYLSPGDTVVVSVTGLGSLTNRIGNSNSQNPIVSQVKKTSYLQQSNVAKILDSSSLTQINNKPLYYKGFGQKSGSPVIFIHGLGGSTEFYEPLIRALDLERSHSLHCFDLEGHGSSPTSPRNTLSIESFAEDVRGVFDEASITTGATLVAHSMGCLVAVQFVLSHPDKVTKLILLGPPPSPLPEAGRAAIYARADTVRAKGMQSVVDAVAIAETSDRTKSSNHVAVTAVRLSLLSQDPEGYSKACAALAGANSLDFAAIQPDTLIITGSEDKVSPHQLCESYVKGRDGRASLQVLHGTGHWHVFEDLQGTAGAIRTFLSI